MKQGCAGNTVVMLVRITLYGLALLVTTISAAEEKFRFERQLMGTRFMIVGYSVNHAIAEAAAATAFARAGEINQACPLISVAWPRDTPPISCSNHSQPQAFPAP